MSKEYSKAYILDLLTQTRASVININGYYDDLTVAIQEVLDHEVYNNPNIWSEFKDGSYMAVIGYHTLHVHPTKEGKYAWRISFRNSPDSTPPHWGTGLESTVESAKKSAIKAVRD